MTPTVLLIKDPDDDVPGDFVRTKCHVCKELGWLAPQSVHTPWPKYCERCYWIKLQVSEVFRS